MDHKHVGFSVLEMMMYSLIFMMMTVMALPSVIEWSDALRVELAAGEMIGVLHRARIYSAQRNAKVAVKFRTESGGLVTYALYRDGDGDGVLSADIENGVDPEVKPPQRLAQFGKRIRFGFPPGDAPRDPGDPRRRLDRLEDPIRFNRSDLASFNPRGTATPGTVYITDGRRHLAAVRVNNKSGKITVLRYEPETEIWRR